MLVEVSCDRFIKAGRVRPPIKFRKGLNVILGDIHATNSIGKSTFLMILDFVFGGNDYIVKSSDVQEQIGPHDIRFAFEFEGKRHCFTRNTARPNRVLKCDENYISQDEVSVDEFCMWLKQRYAMTSVEGTFRNAISGYLRIYQRKNYDENLPLRSFETETYKQSIERLLRLFGRYAELEQKDQAAKRAKEESDVFGKSVQFGYVEAVASKKDCKAVREQIIGLRHRAETIKASIEQYGVSEAEAQYVQSVKDSLRTLTRRRSYLVSALERFAENGMSFLSLREPELRAVKKFFPGIDVKSLEEIEQFHLRLNEIVSAEIESERESILNELQDIDGKIAQLKALLQKSEGTSDSVVSPLIDEYYSNEQKIRRLKNACDNFENIEKLRVLKKTTSLELEDAAKNTLQTVQDSISGRMRELNTFVYSADRSAPQISIPSMNKYAFVTPEDSGTGTACKGMVLLDLALLGLTALPVLIHDSFFLKQIGDSPLERILQLYDSANKQVFIALDKAESYTAEAVNILERAKVLYLSENEFALFGRSWAIRKHNEE